MDPTLSEAGDDAIYFLLVFATRYRDGTLAKSRRPVRARTVEDAVRAVGQTMAMLGAPDRRFASTGKVDIRLQRLLKAFSKDDPQPNRVKPAPLSLLLHMHSAAQTTGTPKALAIADMSMVGFFFLCRPGEHVLPTSTPDPTARSSPFRLRNVLLFCGSRRLDPTCAPILDLEAADHAQLTYEDQKNAVRAEAVGHGRSHHPVACPVRALIRRVVHLRTHHADPDTPLHTFYDFGRSHHVTAADLTTALRAAATALFPLLGIPPAELSARSLRSGGATAMLCARIDPQTIRMLGRWHSDEMLRYLHLQALPHTRSIAADMVQHGSFTFRASSDLLPEAAQRILQT
jgi:hypothetical protein